MTRVIKVEVGSEEERRMEKMRVGSVSYELVLRDVEETYNMPRGSCRLFSVDSEGGEIAIGSTSWDELGLDEDVRARFDLWSLGYHRSSPSIERFFDFDYCYSCAPKPSIYRLARSPSPGFDSFSRLLASNVYTSLANNTRHPTHEGGIRSPTSVSFDMTGLEEQAKEDVEMDSSGKQNDYFDHRRSQADSFQPTLSHVDYIGFLEQNQLPTPASSPPPQERSSDHARSTSRRPSYSRRTSSTAARSLTTASSNGSQSPSLQSASVSNQAGSADIQNKVSTTAQMATRVSVSNRQDQSASPRRPASPARDLSLRSNVSTCRIASPRPSLEITPISPSLFRSTSDPKQAHHQFSQNEYVSSPKHCARSPERWC